MRRLALLAVLLAPALATAHVVPKDNHDRTVIVHLTPEAVIVDFRLELDEYRAVRDLPVGALKGVESRKDFHLAFRRHFAPVLADNLVALLDGTELTFECREQRSEVLDHVRCDFRFVAPWKLTGKGPHRFTFREGNYPLDSFSVLRVTLAASPLLTVRDLTAPSEELMDRPADRRGPGDEEKLRKLSATVLAEPSFQRGPVRPPLPPELDSARPAPLGRGRLHASSLKPGSSKPVGFVKTSPPEEQSEHGNRLLELLFDTKQGLAVLLLLAALFGAVHALTPGHGKALVAAYLVGQRGTAWHALVLGLVTTLSHTGSVLILAVILALSGVPLKRVEVALMLITGLGISGVGLWLLMQRLAGRADHVHLGDGYSAAEGPGAAWWPTIVLGITGGLVPCWDAIILLLISINIQRPWLGVALLLAFSAGLAWVLVVLGLLVVGARAGLQASASDGGRVERLIHLLPIASAIVIIVIGLIMTFGSARFVR
jgi:ABC-type nickel/cobalt efflux system permease component RcnA